MDSDLKTVKEYKLRKQDIDIKLNVSTGTFTANYFDAKLVEQTVEAETMSALMQTLKDKVPQPEKTEPAVRIEFWRWVSQHYDRDSGKLRHGFVVGRRKGDTRYGRKGNVLVHWEDGTKEQESHPSDYDKSKYLKLTPEQQKKYVELYAELRRVENTIEAFEAKYNIASAIRAIP